MAIDTLKQTQEILHYLQALLPSGLAWSKDPNSHLGKLLQALAENLNLVQAQAATWVDEMFPPTSIDFLSRWEKITGTQNTFWPSETTQQRQAVLTQQLNLSGTLSKSFFENLAYYFGFEASIAEYFPFRIGQALAGDRLNNGPWRATWTMTLKPLQGNSASVSSFQVGKHMAGERLQNWVGIEKVREAILAFKPAHTQLHSEFLNKQEQ